MKKNKVLNFSQHLRDDRPFLLPQGMRLRIVPASMDAVKAAELAEKAKHDILIVVEDGKPRGLFFLDYLHKLLPTHSFVTTRVAPVMPGTPVSKIIRQLDAAGVDFHSEHVNLYVRVCPAGHVTEDNPCLDHHLPTTEY